MKRKIYDPNKKGVRRIKEPPPKKKYKKRVVEIGAYIDKQLYLKMAVRFRFFFPSIYDTLQLIEKFEYK